MLFYLVPSCTHFCMLSRQYCFICVCLEKELRKSLVIPDSHEQWLLQCKISLRIVSRDTARQALDRPPPFRAPPPSEQFDYQIKIYYQIDCQRSFVKDRSRVNRKSTVKIDLQKSILYWMYTPITFCLNFVANGVP